MRLVESPLLLQGTLTARSAEATLDPAEWLIDEEVILRSAAGELVLRQADRTIRLEATAQSGPLDTYAEDAATVWLLAKIKSGLVTVRCARPSKNTTLDGGLQIAVDQRIADDLHRRKKSNDPSIAAAIAWLTEEFICQGLDVSTRRVFAAIHPRSQAGSIQLVGRHWMLDVKRAERDALLIERVRRVSMQNLDAYAILEGDIAFVDINGDIRLRDGYERAVFDASVSSDGTYLDLWKLYGDLEWRREVQAAAELGALRYTRCELASEEGGAWRIWADPIELASFQARFRSLPSNDDRLLELDEDAPDWSAKAFTDLRSRGLASRLRGSPNFRDGTLILLGRPSRELPQTGFVFLSLGGHRTQHERRLRARLAIESGEGVPRLKSLLQDLPIPGRRPSRLPALTSYARQSFKSGRPTSRQEEAISVALNTPDIALIIGPPGTGKTQVIAALERRLAELNEGKSIAHEILISSFQHDAVENALERTSVYGLPAVKIGRRSGTSDAVDRWCADRHRSVGQRLEDLAAVEPHVPLLNRLDRLIVSLQMVSMPVSHRKAMFEELGGLVDELARTTRIRTSSRWIQDWAEYVDRFRERTQHSARLELQPHRRRLIRLTRALRVLPASFSDDGALRAAELLLAVQAEAGLISGEEAAIFREAQSVSEPPIELLHNLAGLRNRLLDRLRPDLRPTDVRNQLDEEGSRLISGLQSEISEKVAATRFGRFDVLQRYHDALESDRGRVRHAVETYSSIVGATCQQSAGRDMAALKSINSTEVNAVRFNTVIVDEAARANPLDLFIPMSMARRRIVLVGDHRQLPHLLDAAIEDEVVREHDDSSYRQAYQQSLFERLWRQLKHREVADGFSRVVVLDTQFRMHPTLGDFVSRHFYESVGLGKIESGRTADDFDVPIPGFGSATCAWIDVPKRLGKEDRSGNSRLRICEATRVATEVSTLLDKLPVGMGIGVITFYAAQRDRILEALEKHEISERVDGGWRIRSAHASTPECAERLRVGTVDAFQGKEFDVVVLSVVRSNDLPINAPEGDAESFEEAASRKYGHLRVPNRLNVAMSRQRRLLLAVGDRAMFASSDARSAVPELAAFLDLCELEVTRVR